MPGLDFGRAQVVHPGSVSLGAFVVGSLAWCTGRVCIGGEISSTGTSIPKIAPVSQFLPSIPTRSSADPQVTLA